MSKKTSSRKKLTRQEKRDLDIEISFLEGIVRRDPRYTDAIQVLADDYTRRERFEDGLRLDQVLAELRPDDPVVHYNLACSFSLSSLVEDAARALEKAIALGYRDFKWLGEDPDLENLRQHASYKRIRAKVRTLQVKIR